MRKALLYFVGSVSSLAISFLFSGSVLAYPLTPQTPTNIGGDLHMVKIADMDNDGNNDIVVSDGKQIRGFAVLFGNGDGTFSSPLIMGDSDSYEWGLWLADMNNDGLKDVINTNGALDVVQISLNNGARSFSPASNYPIGDDIAGESSLAIADFNGDGNSDIAVAGGINQSFHIFMGDGSGSISSPVPFSANDPHDFHHDVEAVDFDSDSIIDIITTDNSDLGDIEFFRGDGNGGFNYDHSIADVSANSLSVADIDGDGQQDIVYSEVGVGVFVIRQDGGIITSFSAPSAEIVETFDINTDGNIDVMFSDGAVVGVQVAISLGGGSFNSPDPHTVSFSPLGMSFGDLDGDGLPDAAAVNHGDVLSIFLTNQPQAPGIVVNNSTNPAAAEGGANGYFDIVLTSNPTDVVIIELTSSGSQIDIPKKGVCFVPSGQSLNPGTPYDPCTTWNVGQSVEVTAIDDSDVEGTHADQVVFSVSSADSNYNAFAKDNLPVTVYDNENPPTIQINYSTKAGDLQPASISEDGLRDVISLTLGGIPKDNVTVRCSPSSTDQAIFTPNPIEFIYSPINANSPQIVDVEAIDDSLVEGGHSVSLNCVTESKDSNYDSLNVTIPVNIADNDSTPITPIEPAQPPETAQTSSSADNISGELASTGQDLKKATLASGFLLLSSALFGALRLFNHKKAKIRLQN